MSMVDKAKSKRLLAIHGWSGTLLGILLYLVVLTGTVAVFAYEISSWSAGSTAAERPLNRTVAAKIVELGAEVPDEWHEHVAIYPNAGGNITAFFHGHETDPASGAVTERGVMFELDKADASVLSRIEGTAEEVYRKDRAAALASFIVELHINLHIPYPWGLYATGLLGFVLMISAVSGLLLHKHLFRDVFVAPRLSSLLLNKHDRHILAGSWSLPFAFVLAFTGAFFSFATTIGAPIVAITAFGGDQEAMFEVVLEQSPLEEDASLAPTRYLGVVFEDVEARTGVAPTNATIENFGRADAAISVYAEPGEGELIGGNYLYSGASGEFLGKKPLVGNQPSASSTAFGLMGSLHFGSFAGLFSKIVWIALGLAMSYVTLTGMLLWTQRREDERLWRGFSAGITITGYGVPLAMTGAAIGFFATYGAGGDTHFWTAVGSIVAAFFAIVIGLSPRSLLSGLESLRIWFGLSLFVLPVLRLLTGGIGWVDAMTGGASIIVSLDLLCFVLGAFFLAPKRWHDRATHTAAPALQPAE